MLENVFVKEEKQSPEVTKKRITAMELLAGVQPLVFFQREPDSPLSLENVLKVATAGSALWEQLAVSCNFIEC